MRVGAHDIAGIDRRRNHDRAVTIALLLYASYNLAATLASLQGGRLGDRRGMLSVLAFGVAAFLIAYTGFAYGA